MFHKKNKTENESYHSPKETTKAKKWIIGLIVLALIVLGLVVYLVYNYMNNQKEIQCGILEAENNITEGKVPFVVNAKAKVSGEYDKNMAICEWTIDGKKTSNTVPVNGECVLSNWIIKEAGDKTIKYNISGLNGCPRELTLHIE